DDKGAGLVVKRVVQHWDFFGDPAKLRNVTEAQLLRDLFHAEVPIPAARQRARALREVGTFLHAHRNTRWLAWLERFHSPVELATYLATQFESFNDPFLKRAQLFVGMLIGRYGADPRFPARLRNPEGMTAFFDYILPMIEHRMGILKYRADLEQRIKWQL